MTGTASPLHLFLIAGEPSGDALGAGLMAALRARHGDAIRFSGIGGPLMRAEGLESLFTYDELSIMGLAEVAPKIAGIYRRVRQTVAAIESAAPDALITIDAPGFTLAVAKRVRTPGLLKIHYVAPTVWAWRKNRVHTFRRTFDHLLALLPFEPPLFEAAGLACTFVGHPVADGAAASGKGAVFRARYEMPQQDLLICVLPGSRIAEIRRMMPPFGAALALLSEHYPNTRYVIPALPNVEAAIRDEARKWRHRPRIVPALVDRYDAMAASDLALAASGTVALELAAARVPTVIAYKMAPLTVWLARRMVKVDHINMVNILLGRGAVPEFLQGDVTPEALEEALETLITNADRRNDLLAAQDTAIEMLIPPRAAGRPSDCAAATVLDIVAAGRRGGQESAAA